MLVSEPMALGPYQGSSPGARISEILPELEHLLRTSQRTLPWNCLPSLLAQRVLSRIQLPEGTLESQLIEGVAGLCAPLLWDVG